MDQLGNLSVVNNEEDITVVFVEMLYRFGFASSMISIDLASNSSSSTFFLNI
jgi:hypothetical protein